MVSATSSGDKHLQIWRDLQRRTRVFEVKGKQSVAPIGVVFLPCGIDPGLDIGNCLIAFSGLRA
jgi:hypothetical protein